MARFALLLAVCAAFAANADLAQVQSVYMLPMSSGLDQYLADFLTSRHVYQVVTDPKRADAVFTDQIGAGFEQRMAELYPPEPAEEPKKAETKEKEAPKDAKGDAVKVTGERKYDGSSKPLSTFSRGKGTVFLVDLKSRRVLWSLYARPKRSIPDELHAISRRIVDALERDLKGKQP
ncbi:MAG: hypothetical protein U0Q16_36070 [Bryobacteraceae bacterium]